MSQMNNLQRLDSRAMGIFLNETYCEHLSIWHIMRCFSIKYCQFGSQWNIAFFFKYFLFWWERRDLGKYCHLYLSVICFFYFYFIFVYSFIFQSVFKLGYSLLNTIKRKWCCTVQWQDCIEICKTQNFNI